MPPSSQISRVKPPALQPGDTVGIIAPASNIKRELLDAGCNTLRDLGYRPFYFDSIFEQDLYFAGSIDRRARELEEMFGRDDVRAIICARGGYGANYLLDRIDLEKIKAHPKIFIGYSDVTTLLTRLSDATGLITFHGPMVTKDFAHSGGVDEASWQAATSGSADWTINSNAGVRPLIEGAAGGVLYGGCLSMLAASLGTPYEIQTANTILFIEDVAAMPYQIDRMLMQLKLAGKLDQVRGLVFGEMMDCEQTKEQGYTLEDVVLRIVRDLNIPVAWGLRSGHVSRGNVTLPLGVRAELTVTPRQVSLQIMEPATVPRSMHARETS
jgi:muramoyltetrapeptide carboxypeptidase